MGYTPGCTAGEVAHIIFKMLSARRGRSRAHRVGMMVLLSAWLALPGAAAPAQSASPNLLKNPGFDWLAQTNGDVCAPGWQKDNAITPHEWTAYWTCKSGEEVFQDQINRPPEFHVMTVDIAPDRVRRYPDQRKLLQLPLAQSLSRPVPDCARRHAGHTPALQRVGQPAHHELQHPAA